MFANGGHLIRRRFGACRREPRVLSVSCVPQRRYGQAHLRWSDGAELRGPYLNPALVIYIRGQVGK
jgi:hypothetical protein